MSTCKFSGCVKAERTRGWCPMHYERWRRHGDPSVIKQRSHHDGTPTGTGYWHTMRGGERKQEHVWVAERALGKPLPPGAIVHHIDENPLNNAPTNLVICPDRAYHHLLHQRMRALEACGNPSWRKCWSCKRYDAVENMTEVPRRSGSYFQHNACIRKRYADRKASSE